jgi:hypothetical protein
MINTLKKYIMDSKNGNQPKTTQDIANESAFSRKIHSRTVRISHLREKMNQNMHRQKKRSFAGKYKDFRSAHPKNQIQSVRDAVWTSAFAPTSRRSYGTDT